MKLIVLLVCIGTSFLSADAVFGADETRSPPNIVLIIGDDCGWTDYGFMGHPVVQTPALDRLARESMTFKSGYVAAPLCCPSLAAILTGLHPHQNGVLGNEPPKGTGDRTRFHELVDQVPTLPRLLGERGYLSFQTGKWWHGHYSHGGFTHGMTLKGRHGDAGLSIGREGMQPIFDFIQTARQQEKPFFVWYAPMMPHTPHTPPARLLEKYQVLDKSNAPFYGMIEWFDETCGELLDHLDQQGLRDNTIVVYLADNGWKQGESNPLRDGKRSPYEGGTRTPVLIRWPGHIQPGVSTEPVMSIDLAPTLLSAAGLSSTAAMQGLNLLDLLEGRIQRDCVFGAAYQHDMQDWDEPEKSLQARWVIEGGKWKLLARQNTPELYDLAADPHEQVNLAEENPDVVERLSARLDQWWGIGKTPEMAGSTKGVIDFQRPANALQLVGESGSIMIPESRARCGWTFQDGVLTASPRWDGVVTPSAYRDFRLHLEFNLNDAGDVPREKRSNSGIYIQQRYELQILNSHGVPENEYRNDDCGSVYGMKKPDRMLCRPPGEWQDFDIAFRAARYDGGRKTENARITVYHNGELIHDDFELRDKTGAGLPEENSLRPIGLQGHQNPVQFRNIWIQELPAGDSAPASDIPRVTVSEKTLPLAGEVFQFNGSDAFVILPQGVRNPPDKIAWVWYAPTLPAYPAKEELWMFGRFLQSGIAIAGIDVGESFGSPDGRKKYDEFYRYLVSSRNFENKPCLLARSRGGLMLYSWAIDNPQSVSGIAGIYPVCNIASYPGIEKACHAFGLSAEQLQTDLKKFNPVDRLKPLADAKVPLFHIHGDLDEVVPLNDNSALLAARYRELGGEIELEVVAGQGHNMWDGWFQSENLVSFVSRCLGRSGKTTPIDRSALIERAVGRLIEIQEADGAWLYEGVYRVNREIPVGYRIGGTAIVCAALLDAPIVDRSKADEAIRRGIRRILEELEHPLMKVSTANRYDVRVWGHIYALEILIRLKTSGRFADLEENANRWIERLVPILVEEQLEDGGWNYASRDRHATFVTAPALQALLLARASGVAVDDSVFDRGVEALLASRGENGAFSYSGKTSVTGEAEKLPGSIARNPVGESTLLMLGKGDSQHLQSAIDSFYEHWDELEKRRKKTGTHVPPYGVAPYYFYYGHRYLAQSIALLPEESREKEYERFDAVLLRTMDEDHTWNDRVFERSRAFGTAMAVLALSRDAVPLPSKPGN